MAFSFARNLCNEGIISVYYTFSVYFANLVVVVGDMEIGTEAEDGTANREMAKLRLM